MTKLSLIELEQVTGGESDEEYTYYWDVCIYVSKKAGKSLDQVLAELRSCGQPQNMIDYVIANWSNW